MDLVIAPGPGVVNGLTIPGTDLTERFSRSPGPGGQSVNTTDSRVGLELDIAGCAALTEPQRRRVQAALEGRLVGGRLVVTAYEHRSQHRNRVAARERMAELLRSALAPPPPSRRATKPTKGSTQRRLEAKKHRGEVKSTRARPARSDTD